MKHDQNANMLIEDWKKRLAFASDEGEVVALSRQFIESLSAEDRLLLGPEFAAARLVSHDSVAECALGLIQKEMALSWQDAEASATMRVIGGVFIEASKRLSALSEARVLRNFDHSRERRQSGE